MLQGKRCQDSLLSGEGRSLGAKISGEGVVPGEYFFGFYKTTHILLPDLSRLSCHSVQQMFLKTRRPASAARTARRQFQAISQPVSGTQASDAMTSRLPRYDAKCVQRRCFQYGSVPLHTDIKGTELPPANILIPLERQFRRYKAKCVKTRCLQEG